MHSTISQEEHEKNQILLLQIDAIKMLTEYVELEGILSLKMLICKKSLYCDYKVFEGAEKNLVQK
jgi:hypothetical protein